MKKFLAVFLFVIFLFTTFNFSQEDNSTLQSPVYMIPNTISNFRFNFINPGGRATGMGGAFIAVANDATASETNPAGLIFIPKPMFFTEFRRIKYTFDRIYDGYYDEVKGPQVINRHFTRWVSSPTFLSFVYPKNSWAIAFYRQELANFRIFMNNKDFRLNKVGYLEFSLLNRQKIFLDFHLTNYGVSFAKKLHETFAVGFSVRAAHLDFKAFETANLDPNRPKPSDFHISTEGRLEVTSPDYIAIYTDINDDDWKLSYVAGFQWRPSDKISFGMVYRYGAKHHLSATFYENLLLQTETGKGFEKPIRIDLDNFEINVPDRLGFGISCFPTDRWTVSFDIVRIFYSDLNHQFQGIMAEGARKYYAFEDGNEYRFGFEYTIPIGLYDSISLRAGYYASPDPSIHYLNNATSSGPEECIDAYYLGKYVSPPLGYDHHGTFGVGVVIFKNLQIDLAGDLGTRKDLFVISCMYNF